MMQWLLIFAGGGLGSMCRFALSNWLSSKAISFPWGTFAANLISSLILGVLIGIQMQSGLSENKKLFLMIGFCGGFSTFSTFSAELFQLIENQQLQTAFLYVASSVLLGIAMIFLGIKLSLSF
jgi:CrcB protein